MNNPLAGAGRRRSVATMTRRAGLPALLMLACVVAGCAGNSGPRPVAPDLTVLEPAEEAIAQARAIRADELAPEALREAQRRVSLARTIVLQSALQGTQPDEAQRVRIEQLVEEARVDAMLASAVTQREAVGNALGEYEKALAPPPTDSPDAGSQPASNPSGPGSN